MSVGWATMSRMTEPTVVERAERPYVGIVNYVSMDTIPEAADRLREVFDWIHARGIEMAEAPFFKYNVIDMDGELEIEVGIPIPTLVDGEGEIVAGTLPAGRYATVSHVGHPQELYRVTADLLAWAEREGLRFAKEDTPAGEVWESRLEVYSTDPAVEPDMNKWETTLLFKLA
jgi:effector-binding domain-containing protein